MNPQSFGKYQLLKKLATGGMAEVWLARHSGIEGFQRLLVVKRILPHLADDPEFVQMFLNEAKIAARFNHPNIAQIYDLGEANGTYFIAMEFVHGEDLGRVMRKAWSAGQWIARPLAIRIVASACEGLFYAHSKMDEKGNPLKVVHRDISPQNILISFDGSVKVVDFGIAKAADAQSMTRSGAIKGKFAYMSPEQAGGQAVDQRSDIFSLGLVLYELLTGVRPLKRDSELATLQAALECRLEPPSKVADVPSDLDPVVMTALARAADDRFRDARAFQMALEEFLVGQRWVATSVQVSELMSTLFHDRLEEEARLGYPDPVSDESASGTAPPPLPPPLPQRESTSTQAADMNWDAPAATGPVREPEVRPSGPRKRTLAPAPAPAADAPPPRRTSGENETSVEGYRRRTASRVAVPRKTASRQVRRIESDDEATLLPDEYAAREPQGGGPRRTGQFSLGAGRSPSRPGDMPEPPPPSRRASRVIAANPAHKPLDIDLDSVVDPEAPKRGRGAVKFAVFAALVMILVGVGVVFRAPVLKFLTRTANDGAEMFVSVDSNIPVELYVEHHPDEGRPEPLVHLGQTPVKRVGGVHVGDHLILENKMRGVRERQPVPMGQPGEHKQISRDFEMGTYRFRFQPKSLRDLTVLLNGQEVARYPGPAVQLVEGRHTLEVRGPQLKQPAQIEIEVKPGVVTEGKTFDLGKLVQ